MTDIASHCNLLNEEGDVSHFNLRASFLHIWPFPTETYTITSHTMPPMPSKSKRYLSLKKSKFLFCLNAAVLSPSWKFVAKSSTGLAREEESSYLLHSPKAELHQYPQHANFPSHPRTAAAFQPTASRSQGDKWRMLQQDGEMWQKRVCHRREKVWKQVLDEMDITYWYKSRNKAEKKITPAILYWLRPFCFTGFLLG